MAALLLFACSDQKPKAGAPIDGGNGKGIETDTLTSNDGTKAAEGVVSIRKQWISEPDDNGTYLLFEGEFEHTYKALDKPVKLEPNPEKK